MGVFPCMGIMQFNKVAADRAKEDVKSALTCLNDHLLTRTFLVGERISLADIATACTLLNLYKHVLEPNFRKPFGNVNRWFTTVINQPNVKAVIGDFALCTKMAEFDEKKYPEPKEEDDELGLALPAKKKDPLDELPKGSFDMEEWKRFFSNNDEEEAVKWFWEH